MNTYPYYTEETLNSHFNSIARTYNGMKEYVNICKRDIDELSYALKKMDDNNKKQKKKMRKTKNQIAEHNTIFDVLELQFEGVSALLSKKCSKLKNKNRALKERVKTLEEQHQEILQKMDSQSEIIENIKKQNTHTQDTIYHIICGLYNKNTQQNTFQNCVNKLVGNYKVLKTDSEDPYPTTRQGDLLEKHLYTLDDKLNETNKKMNDTINILNNIKGHQFEFLLSKNQENNYKDSDTYSNHSIIPDLISIDSPEQVIENSEMIDYNIIPYSDSSSSDDYSSSDSSDYEI